MASKLAAWVISMRFCLTDDPSRQRMAVHFGGPVVETERRDLAIDALHDGVGGDAHAAEDLQRTIDDTAQRLGAEHLALARLGAGVLALVEQPRGMPDRETR